MSLQRQLLLASLRRYYIFHLHHSNNLTVSGTVSSILLLINLFKFYFPHAFANTPKRCYYLTVSLRALVKRQIYKVYKLLVNRIELRPRSLVMKRSLPFFFLLQSFIASAAGCTLDTAIVCLSGTQRCVESETDSKKYLLQVCENENWKYASDCLVCNEDQSGCKTPVISVDSSKITVKSDENQKNFQIYYAYSVDDDGVPINVPGHLLNLSSTNTTCFIISSTSNARIGNDGSPAEATITPKNTSDSDCTGTITISDPEHFASDIQIEVTIEPRPIEVVVDPEKPYFTADPESVTLSVFDAEETINVTYHLPDSDTSTNLSAVIIMTASSDSNCVTINSSPQTTLSSEGNTAISVSPANNVSEECTSTVTVSVNSQTQTYIQIPVTVTGFNDDNHNYMIDFYENAEKQGDPCKTYSDCNTVDQNGFCDSFIGYACSTPCSNDSQCISSDYYCRPDGRCAPKVFETIWETTTANDFITIPTEFASHCNFTIEWGDGSSAQFDHCPPSLTHTYASAGTYHVKITGSYDDFAFTKTKNTYKPTEYCKNFKGVETFGPVGLGGKYFYDFYKCNNGDFTFSGKDIPDASKLTNMAYMFSGDKNFNSDISNWDIHNVTNLSYTFEDASVFNQPIGVWDTSNVTTMSRTFASAKEFNQPIGDWNTSKVTKTAYMFARASAFNQDIGKWDVSNVTDMTYMFYDALSFNKYIGDWNTSSVKYINNMFTGAKAYNQDMQNWDMQNVSSTSYMFSHATAFNGKIDHWNLKSATTTDHMFESAQSFNQPLNNWKTPRLKSTRYMFRDAKAFNQPLDRWDVSNVTEMQGMFENAESFDGELNAWNTGNVVEMYYMFSNAKSFNRDLDRWNVSSVRSMYAMFSGAENFNGDVSSWTFSSSLDTVGLMFSNASSFNQSLRSWSFEGPFNHGNMLSNTGMTQENYCDTLQNPIFQSISSNLGLDYTCP